MALAGWDAWRHFSVAFYTQKWFHYEHHANPTTMQKLQMMERIALSAVAAEAYVEALGIVQNILCHLNEVTNNDRESFVNHEIDPEWQTYRDRVMIVFQHPVDFTTRVRETSRPHITARISERETTPCPDLQGSALVMECVRDYDLIFLSALTRGQHSWETYIHRRHLWRMVSVCDDVWRISLVAGGGPREVA